VDKFKKNIFSVDNFWNISYNYAYKSKNRLTNKIKYKKGPFKLLSRQEVQLKGLTPKKV
jgi:hypothetical protein